MTDETPTQGPDHMPPSDVDPANRPSHAGWRPDQEDVNSPAPALEDGTPGRIGAYRLTRLIGEGGMGRVYEAVQSRPRRAVAVKLMRSSIASTGAARRFHFEAELLARLQHPGIAQIYEAGIHVGPDGEVPYFAMEFIQNAQSLVDYAAARAMSLQEKIELFRKVCDAIHHGHQKGVIHRDIKPSNILVPADGQPKVIDFGVARATDSDIALTGRTDVGQLVGTLQYMSPEQSAADPNDIDIRSDVYALGVTLYHLLCGRLPYSLSGRSIYQAIRDIQEIEPVRPRIFVPEIRADLEVIILKALEKDRTRRYQSARELGEDIGRFLHHEPITARPPSVVHQARLFARRHRAWVSAAAVAVLALVATTIISISFAVKERIAREEEQRAREEAEEVTRFLDTDLLGAPEDDDTDPDIRVVTLLDRADATLRDRFQDRPHVQARLSDVLGRAYLALGRTDRAEPLLAVAKEGYLALGRTDDAGVVGSYLAESIWRRDPNRAQSVISESIQSLTSSRSADDPVVLNARNQRAGWLKHLGDLDAAKREYQDVLERRRRVLPPGAEDTFIVRHNLAQIPFERSKKTTDESKRIALLEQALGEMRQVWQDEVQSLGESHRQTIASASELAAILNSLNRLDEAAAMYELVLPQMRTRLGVQHWRTLTTIANFGKLREKQHQLGDAAALYREALDGLRSHYGPANAIPVTVANWLAGVLEAQGDFPAAEAEYHRTFSDVMAAYQEKAETDAPDLADLRTLVIRQAQLLERFFTARGNADEAAMWRDRATAMQPREESRAPGAKQQPQIGAVNRAVIIQVGGGIG